MRVGASKRLTSVVFLPLLVVSVFLVLYGLLVVYSAVSVDAKYNFNRQLAGIAVGIIAMAVIWRFDYRRLAGYVKLFLVINVVLILSPHLPFIGVHTMGATSWINIGMQVQPGEFAKITVILLDAAIVAQYNDRLSQPRIYLKALGLMMVPFVAIMTQPDLGTGLVYLFIGAVALLVSQAPVRYLLITALCFVAFIVLVFLADEALKAATGDYRLLKTYQRNRLLVFMNEGAANASEEGYNVRQAMIAIGSGGLWGQGYMQGSQHNLGILPEAPTDFIFCVLAEEFGLVGSLILLLAYAILIASCIYVALRANNTFGTLIVACGVGMWIFQILENIGMTCSLMPITGIPLPFMSYGSSFMVVNFMVLGLISSVWTHNSRVKE
ncbi:cell cycle protein, FtsW/RodA/SpoVE family [Umbribacter vaginalis]|nr:cell cycle protein, FtsW/RodA/SpoVE family [Coriobacteriales bacterium DNF00809]